MANTKEKKTCTLFVNGNRVTVFKNTKIVLLCSAQYCVLLLNRPKESFACVFRKGNINHDGSGRTKHGSWKRVAKGFSTSHSSRNTCTIIPNHKNARINSSGKSATPGTMPQQMTIDHRLDHRIQNTNAHHCNPSNAPNHLSDPKQTELFSLFRLRCPRSKPNRQWNRNLTVFWFLI